jgi:hypothetical protein
VLSLTMLVDSLSLMMLSSDEVGLNFGREWGLTTG